MSKTTTSKIPVKIPDRICSGYDQRGLDQQGLDQRALANALLKPPAKVYLSSSTPSKILEFGMGKFQRSMLHDVVHEFRQEHGFREKHWPKYSPTYRAALKFYSAKEPPSNHREAIEIMGSAEGYSEIRQAGRMRQSMPPLKGNHLRALASEVRAALIWRALAEQRDLESDRNHLMMQTNNN